MNSHQFITQYSLFFNYLNLTGFWTRFFQNLMNFQLTLVSIIF